MASEHGRNGAPTLPRLTITIRDKKLRRKVHLESSPLPQFGCLVSRGCVPSLASSQRGCATVARQRRRFLEDGLDAALAAVQKQGRASDEPLAVTGRTLRKRLHEGGRFVV
jgi:hypothetical protein